MTSWQIPPHHPHEEWLELFDIMSGSDTAISTRMLDRNDEMFARIRAEVEEHCELELIELRVVRIPAMGEILKHSHDDRRIYVYMPHDHNSRLSFEDPTESYATVEGLLVEIEEGRPHWVTKATTPRYTMMFMFAT